MISHSLRHHTNYPIRKICSWLWQWVTKIDLNFLRIVYSIWNSIFSKWGFFFNPQADILPKFLVKNLRNHPILKVLGTKGYTVLFIKDFIMVLIIGGPFVIANFALGQVVRAEGASKVSMNGMFISVIINIVLDHILILYVI